MSSLGINKTTISLAKRDIYTKYKDKTFSKYYKTQCEVERGFIYNHLAKSLVSNLCLSINPDIEDLVNKYKNHYSDPDLLEKASCLVNTFIPFSNFYSSKSKWDEIFSERDKANKNLKGIELDSELKRINQKQDILYQKGFANNYKDAKTFWGDLIMLGRGSNGIIYESSKDELAKLFIIKYQTSHKLTTERNNMHIIHELHVNLVLNRYRDIIPNFMYGFGFFTCPPPLIDYKTSLIKKKKMDSICNIAGNNMFTIIERIDGLTLREWLKDYSLESFLNYYLQILFSLETAQDISYSHNDLHTSNIIIKPVKKITIEYKINDKSYYVTTDHVATIIDFGYSYIKTNRSFSIGGLISGGVYYNKPNQLLDAYKLLMYSMLELKNNKKDFSELLPLFYYMINPDYNPDNWLEEERESRFSIPDVSRYTNIVYTHRDFIKFILKTYPKLNFISTNPKPSIKQYIIKDKKKSYTTLDFFYLSKTNKLTLENRKQFESKYNTLENEADYAKILSRHFLNKSDEFNTSLDFYLTTVKGKKRLQFDKFDIIYNNVITLLDLASQLVNKRDILMYNYFKRSKSEKDKNMVRRVSKILFEMSTDIWNGITLLVSIYYRMINQEDDDSVYVNYFKGKQLIILNSFDRNTKPYREAYKIKKQIEKYYDVFLILGRFRYISGMYNLDPKKI